MMKFCNSLFLLILLTALCTSSAPAQTKDDSLSDSKHLNYNQPVDTLEYLTGDWGGVRERMINWGVTPTANYTTTLLGNPVGGTTKGFKYAGLLNAYLNFDLEKLLNLGGTRFVISGSLTSGDSLTDTHLGNLFNVSSIFIGNSIRLYQMFLRTDLYDKRINFALGRMAVGDKFATSSIFYNYVSLAFNENPISLLLNDPGFLRNPQSSWGSWFRASPVDELYVMAGAYNSNPKVARDSSKGVDFSFKDGALFIGEVGYLYNHKSGSNKKPGTFKIGAYYDTGKFEEVQDSDIKKKNNYGFYAIGEQMLYRERVSSDQGLTAWAALTLAPDEEINKFPFYTSGGFVYKGLLKKRSHDKTAVAVSYGQLSDDLKDKDYEILLEGTYIVEIAKWLNFQPDVQYVIHPGGSGEIKNALVLGVLLSVDF